MKSSAVKMICISLIVLLLTVARTAVLAQDETFTDKERFPAALPDRIPGADRGSSSFGLEPGNSTLIHIPDKQHLEALTDQDHGDIQNTMTDMLSLLPHPPVQFAFPGNQPLPKYRCTGLEGIL